MTAFETYNHAGCRVEIHNDNDPECPREWYNQFIIACWHDRYILGDRDGVDRAQDALQDIHRLETRGTYFRRRIYQQLYGSLSYIETIRCERLFLRSRQHRGKKRNSMDRQNIIMVELCPCGVLQTARFFH